MPRVEQGIGDTIPSTIVIAQENSFSETIDNLENHYDDDECSFCTSYSVEFDDDAESFLTWESYVTANSSLGNTFNESVDDDDPEGHHLVSYFVPVPKMDTQPLPENMTPITIMVCNTIGLKVSRKILRVLLDSGSTKTLIHRRVLPKDLVPHKLGHDKEVNTLAGNMRVSEVVKLRDVKLPEFDKNRTIDEVNALVFDAPCAYDILMGADALKKSGIDLLYSIGMIEWYGNTIPMRDAHETKRTDYIEMMDSFHLQEEEEWLGYDDDYFDNYAMSSANILDAKYDKVQIDDVVEEQTHLTDQQREDLRKLLMKYTKLFDGTLGVYPHKKFHIELEEGAKPVHARPYPVAKLHEETFKKELKHLCEIGVLAYQGPSEWASPTFIVPKKDGRVRWVSDLRALNKVIKRNVYPLPRIQDILRKRPGYKFFTKLDVSMQYYTFMLDDASSDLCTIVTPYGKFRYLRLPMGLKCSPDIAQGVMEDVLRDIEETDVYIDDVGAFNDSWEEHLVTLERVLTRLQDNGFTINPLKCEWGVQETDWLGFWLTPTGLKPWKKKVDAILQMQKPTNLKELRMFIGAVNYYKDMWPSRAHVLQPLTAMTGKKHFAWTPEMDEAFQKMKAILCQDCLTAYPDHNLRYDIYTDASDFQMGAVLMQKGRPVAYFSRKLNQAQKNYTTMEKELLSIVMTLKEFRTMLLGADIHIHTDHKNLTFANLNTQRVLRWRMYVEEFGPTLHYVPGPKNILADNFSRMPKSGDEDKGEELHEDNFALCYHFVRLPSDDEVMVGKSMIEENNFCFHTPWIAPGKEVSYRDRNAKAEGVAVHHTSILDDPELVECFMHLPQLEAAHESPLRWDNIHEKQQSDEQLQGYIQRYPERYRYKNIDGHQIIVHTKPGDNPDTQWKIALPLNMIPQTITFYHSILGHPGSKRLRDSLQSRYFHPQLRSFCERFHCDICQREKLDGPGYGHLPEREMKEAPWTEVAVDCIGPWTIEVNGQQCELKALTCIDTVTNLVELVRLDNGTAEHCRDKFTQAWLARYPLPARCVHDNGGEFTGYEFQRRLEVLGIKDVPTTSRNPQANAICERMHQTVGNMLRTMLKSNPPQNLQEANDILDQALSTVMHALRVNVGSTIGSSPGALVFGRDMFINLPLIADWHLIAAHREQFVNDRLRRQNAKRRRYDYVVGQRVLKKRHKPTKLGDRTEGPYNVTQVHVNGTITILLNHGVTERINIRRVIPYRE